jgi:hypothetical protein
LISTHQPWKACGKALSRLLKLRSKICKAPMQHAMGTLSVKKSNATQPGNPRKIKR